MTPDPRMLEALNAAGLGDPASGTGAVFGRPRRELPVPRRPYPGQGILLQDYSDLRADTRRGTTMLTEALQGMIERTDYPWTFGVSRSPIGHMVDPFFRVQVDPKLPFEASTVAPFFEDKALNAHFQKQLKPYLVGSGKYPATEPNIKAVAKLLRNLSAEEPFRVLVRQGLASGPTRGAPLLRDAFAGALLLESMATYPDAPMPDTANGLEPHLRKLPPGVVHGRRTRSQWARDVSLQNRSLGRSNRIWELMGELSILQGKGARPGGPLLADTFTMFEERIGPSAGLRKKRGVQYPHLLPYPGEDLPIIAQMEARGRKDIAAEMLYRKRGAASEDVLSMSPLERLTRVEEAIRSRISPQQYRGLLGNIGSYGKLEPEQKMKALLRELDQLEGVAGTGASQQIMEEVAGSAIARVSRGTAPSPTRGGTVAREFEVTSSRTAQKMLEKAQKSMGLKARNPLGVIALAAILSGAMLAYGVGGEETA